MTGKRLVKDSRRAFFRLHSWKRLPYFLHVCSYVRYTQRYVRILLAAMWAFPSLVPAPRREACRPLLANMPDRYHGKVLFLADARQIVTLSRDICVDPERAIPLDLQHLASEAGVSFG